MNEFIADVARTTCRVMVAGWVTMTLVPVLVAAIRGAYLL